MVSRYTSLRELSRFVACARLLSCHYNHRRTHRHVICTRAAEENWVNSCESMFIIRTRSLLLHFSSHSKKDTKQLKNRRTQHFHLVKFKMWKNRVFRSEPPKNEKGKQGKVSAVWDNSNFHQNFLLREIETCEHAASVWIKDRQERER